MCVQISYRDQGWNMEIFVVSAVLVLPPLYPAFPMSSTIVAIGCLGTEWVKNSMNMLISSLDAIFFCLDFEAFY